MKHINLYSLLILSFLFNNLQSQSQFKEFGKVDTAMLQALKYDNDSTVDAVVLFNHGHYYYKETIDDFILVREYHVCIKIFKESGYSWGNATTSLYSDKSSTEEITEFKANTYNWENNSIKISSLTKDAIFEDKVLDEIKVLKFAMPQVHKGSIIEYNYKVESKSLTYLPTWYFQETIPTLSSDLVVEIPEFFNFTKDYREALPIKESTVEKKIAYIFNRQRYVTRIHLNAINVPAFNNVNFISSMKNHVTLIEFELNSLNIDGRLITYINNWEAITKLLMEGERFGTQINKTFLKQTAKQITANCTTDKEKMIAVYNYVRNYMKWNGNYGRYCTSNLKKTYELKTGNDADINLMLVMMLSNINLAAHPIILSTRDNGIINPYYPILNKFNYVACYLRLDQIYILDATDVSRPYNILPIRCLNGDGRVLTEKASSWVNIHMDEQWNESTEINCKIEETGNISGLISKTYKYNSAFEIREKMENGKEKEYINNLRQNNKDWDILSYKVFNKDSIDLPLTEKIEVNISSAIQRLNNKIYISPIFIDKIKNNPFKEDKRDFPVELPLSTKEILLLKIEIPSGYEIEELPKSTILKISEDGLNFKYNINKVDNLIVLTCQLSDKKMIYTKEEYILLKNLYSQIMAKQSEQIILKKL